MPNLAINGRGRIGHPAMKILLDIGGLDLVAVNDITDVQPVVSIVAGNRQVDSQQLSGNGRCANRSNRAV